MTRFVNLKNSRVVNLDRVESIDIRNKMLWFPSYDEYDDNYMDVSFLSDEEMQQLVDMVSEAVIGY